MKSVFFEKLIRFLISPILNTFIALKLGVLDVGVLYQVLAFQALISSLSSFGLEVLISTKRLKKNEMEIFILLKAFASIIMCSYFTFALASSMGIHFIHLFMLSLLVSLLSIVEQFSISLGDYEYFVKLRLKIFLIFSGLKFFVAYHIPLAWMFYLVFSLELILLSVCYWYLRRSVCAKERLFDLSLLSNLPERTLEVSGYYKAGKKLVCDNVKIIVSALLFLILHRFDYLVVASFVTAEDVSFYAWAMIYITPLTSFGGVLAKQLQSSSYAFDQKVSFVVIVVLLLCVAILNLIFREPISTFAAQKFGIPIDVHYALSILIFGVPVSLIASFFTIWNVSKNHENVNLIRAIILFFGLPFALVGGIILDMTYLLPAVVVFGNVINIIPNVTLYLINIFQFKK